MSKSIDVDPGCLGVIFILGLFLFLSTTNSILSRIANTLDQIADDCTMSNCKEEDSQRAP
jgi:hypothetical protein